VKLFGVDAKVGAYFAGFSDGQIAEGESAAQTEARLDMARDGMIRVLSGTITSETKINLDGTYPGRELLAIFTNPAEGTGILRVRIYMVDQRLYMVYVAGKKDWVHSPERDEFLDSFALTN
jgi:hypothetical protein